MFSRNFTLLTVTFIGLIFIFWKLLSIGLSNSHVALDHRGRIPDCLFEVPSKHFSQASKNWPKMNHLIIVPGHAIQWCSEVYKPLEDQTCWFLYDFQQSQVPLYLEHVKVGVQLAIQDPNSILVFSGGQTRPGVGPRSEGRSYYSIALTTCLLEEAVIDRTFTEEFARDSLENVIFSMARFREVTGRLPQKVTVVGFPFKAKRFIELHRAATGIPEANFRYQSVYVPGIDQDHLIDTAYEDFLHDPYGCGFKLMQKKLERNPYKREPGYKLSCLELIPILSKCDGALDA